MAWNEPGGGKDNDPWGGKNQGPPDLDEALKKLQEKLNSIFGGGKGPSGGNGGEVKLGASTLAIIGVLAEYTRYAVSVIGTVEACNLISIESG